MPQRSQRAKTADRKKKLGIGGTAKKTLKVDLTIIIRGTIEQTGQGDLDLGSLIGPMLAKAGRQHPHGE